MSIRQAAHLMDEVDRLTIRIAALEAQIRIMEPITKAAEALINARGRLYETPRPDDAESEYLAAMDALYVAVLA